jgi:antitoxin MazE
MRTAIRKMGNSQGVIIPKPLLIQVGLESEVDLVVENNAIVLRKLKINPREGWANASQKLAAIGDDSLVWPEIGNDDDKKLEW